jgi:hypothetical protein
MTATAVSLHCRYLLTPQKLATFGDALDRRGSLRSSAFVAFDYRGLSRKVCDL